MQLLSTIMLLILTLSLATSNKIKTSINKLKTASPKSSSKLKSSHIGKLKNHKKSKTTSSKPVTPKFPKLSEFFSNRLESKLKTRLTQCDVTTRREQCLYRTSPKKTHCLLFENVIGEVTPYYRLFIDRSKLASFKKHEVKDIRVNTCSRKVTFMTYPQGNFTIIPKGKF